MISSQLVTIMNENIRYWNKCQQVGVVKINVLENGVIPDWDETCNKNFILFTSNSF